MPLFRISPPQQAAKTKAGDLRDINIAIDVLQMTEAGQTFDMMKFYKDIASFDDGTVGADIHGLQSLLDKVESIADLFLILITCVVELYL